MRIIAKRTLIEAGQKYGPDVMQQLLAWHGVVKEAEWRKSQDIRNDFNNAKIITNEVVVFKICFNRFRLVIKVWYTGQEVYIKHFVPHTEYDDLDLKDL